MDYKMLGKSICTVGGIALFSAGVINLLIWIIHNFSPMVLAGGLLFGLLCLLVAIDYQRRQFLKACGK